MGMRIDPDARFKRLREQAKSEVGSERQRAEEALKRRFASQGLGSSGAAIKAEQQVGKQAESALARRIGNIESAQESDALRRQEIKEGREFARGEREAGQSFAAGQSELARKFARGERLSSQEFADLQREKGQTFAAAQNKMARDLQRKAQELQSSQFGQQMEMAKRQFELDEEVTRFNMDLAKQNSGGGGFLDDIGQGFSINNIKEGLKNNPFQFTQVGSGIEGAKKILSGDIGGGK